MTDRRDGLEPVVWTEEDNDELLTVLSVRSDPWSRDACNCIRSWTARVAALTAERDALRACLAWTNEVYPARIDAGGARVDLTWDEFNAMREAAGFRPVKRIGDQEGRAGFNHRLRAELAALRERAEAAEEGERLWMSEAEARSEAIISHKLDLADAVLRAEAAESALAGAREALERVERGQCGACRAYDNHGVRAALAAPGTEASHG